ncbi:prolyl oligopeptidase family serine peptidase [Kineosporia mesophila]|uniref:prolyl oligopeptidase n=1 Tax=Kineosporia mesophila TaxID=566012 RepID=A0ABP6ZV93_9ACTN|nr:prolyl oligopeptidase family serine peptidase [Kineosporia mesophila]MCD5348728.1 prolyl oligopeptidase family serine peptidase [Kineosporia mesophila]
MPTPSGVSAERLDLVDELHGQPVPDPYRWLEDASDDRTQKWSQQQDELFTTGSAHWPGRERIGARLGELMGAGVTGVPIWRGRRVFSMRREPGQEHSVLYVQDSPDSERRVLVDPVAIDPGGTTTLDAWQPDREGARLAYQLSEGGTEESVLRVIDVTTGELLDGPIDRARYSPVSWIPGGLPAPGTPQERVPAFFYVRRLPAGQVPAGEEQYHRRIWLHRLGSDPSTDVRVFGDGHDPRTYFGVGLSRDGRWLIVSAAVGTAPRNDVWIADLTAPGGHETPQFTPIATGLDAQFGAHVGRDGRLYVFTDLDAPRGRLAVTDPSTPSPANWRDLIPQHEESVLQDYTVLDGEQLIDNPLLLARWTRHAVSEVTVHDLDSGSRYPGPSGSVELPGIGTVGGLVARPEGGHECWFTYTDHVTPPHVYRLDGLTGKVELFAAPPGSIQGAEVPKVITRQIEYPSADGTIVRMFVTSRADLLSEAGEPLSPRPTILYGYGGFGVPMTPGYSATILAWAEAGGVYAVAGLRGGSEEGEDWHRAGMLGHKQNVFDDFHAAAEHLISQQWTSPGRLAISGGSNGGLLVGAALTQRPELYRAVVCSAPLLDMIRYEKFGLGATWNVEYGSADDAEQFGQLLAYSPYHRVKEGVNYPATLFTVFDGDTRVDPLHARKLCAALQHANSGEHPILIRREKDVGHGARSLSRTITLSTDTMTFLAAQTGLEL